MEPPMKPAIKTANCAKGFIMIFEVYNIKQINIYYIEIRISAQ